MNERSKHIRLNFYPITQQEFEFRIWRRKYQGERKEGMFENLHRNTLPKEENINDRLEYWISFGPLQDFQEFGCKQDYNRFLTQHFLFYLLRQKVEKTLKSNEYILPKSRFREQIFFVIENHPEGKETVWLEPYFLQPNNKFGFLIDFDFHKSENTPFSRIVQKLSLSLDGDFRSNRNFYIDKYRKIQEFFRKFEKKIFPLTLPDGEINISATPENLPIAMLETKTYVFGDSATDTSQYRGLEENGPLQSVNQAAVLMLLYRKKDAFLAEDLIKALKGEAYGVQFKGLEKVFGLRIEKVKKIEIVDFSDSSLDSVLKEILSRKKTEGDSLIMPMLIGDKDDESTYYSMKYKLLGEKLPLQVVTAQLLRKGGALKWSASNIALQIFAKIGGKPWKVLPSHEKSIIFGIGQAHQKSNGDIIKYFAYSVCTDSSGLYKKINVLGRSTHEESYLEQLKTNIITTIEEHLDGDYTKFVLHIPFKIKKKELQVIDEAIKDFAESKQLRDVDFVVLRINAKNKFFGYAYTNSLVPYESTCALLSRRSPRSYLVWLEGLQYHRETIHKRMSGPVYIEFYWSDKELDRSETKRYLQDVLNLSGANWRGFNAKNLPISIYYCELVASFLKRFPEQIENIENITNPWFL